MEERYEEQIVEEYKKSKESPFRNILARITVVHILIIGVLVLLAYSVLKNTTDKKVSYIIYGVFITIIIVLMYKPSKEKNMLPRWKIVELVEAEANRMVRGGKEFAFDSKVFVQPPSSQKWENDMTTGTSGPTSWDIRADEYIHGSQYIKQWVFSVHPYSGIITGIREMKFGYDGTQSKDKIIVPVGVVQGNMKTTDWGLNPKP